MKTFILIAVLAALTVYNDAASIPDEITPYEDIIVTEEADEFFQKDYNYDLEGRSGRFFEDDELILFYEELVNLPAIPNVVQIREVVFEGNSTTRINRISVSNVPSHTFVGNYRTHGLVRLTSAAGRGILSRVQFSGHYADQV